VTPKIEPVREVASGPQRVAGAETHTETYTASSRPERSSAGWILPLALVAGLLGLLWYSASRPGTRVRAAREDVNATQTTTPRERHELEDTASFERLRNKYLPVIQQAEAQGVKISELRAHGGKLIVKGTAPSQEAANNVWNEIKRVNPNLNDIQAEFRVDSSMAPAPLVAPPLQESEKKVETDKDVGTDKDTERDREAEKPSDDAMDEQAYIVKSGDTLRSISKHFFGDAGDYMRIFNANQDKLTNPNVIEVGQELTIPGR